MCKWWANIAQGEAEGCKDGVDRANLDATKGSENASEKADLSVEENAKERGKELGHNDGGKDGKEKWEQLEDL